VISPPSTGALPWGAGESTGPARWRRGLLCRVGKGDGNRRGTQSLHGRGLPVCVAHGPPSTTTASHPALPCFQGAGVPSVETSRSVV